MSNGRPKDAVATKFTGPVMDEICALVPDFPSYQEAEKFWYNLLKRKRVKTLLDIRFQGKPALLQNDFGYDKPSHAYFCWWQEKHGPELADNRQNPMEVLHLFAHIVQPPGTAFHKGEFGSIFLGLIELVYDADMKRQAKNIMITHKIRTSAKSPETREKQAAAYHKRRVASVPERAMRSLFEFDQLRGFRDDG